MKKYLLVFFSFIFCLNFGKSQDFNYSMINGSSASLDFSFVNNCIDSVGYSAGGMWNQMAKIKNNNFHPINFYGNGNFGSYKMPINIETLSKDTCLVLENNAKLYTTFDGAQTFQQFFINNDSAITDIIRLENEGIFFVTYSDTGGSKLYFTEENKIHSDSLKFIGKIPFSQPQEKYYPFDTNNVTSGNVYFFDKKTAK